MRIDTWLPIFVGLSLYIPVLIGALWLPETFGVSQSKQKPKWVRTTGPSIISSGQQHVEREQQTRRLSWIRRTSAGLCRRWSTAKLVIRENATVSLLLLTFLITVLGNESSDLLLQFARRRFGWSWSQVSPFRLVAACSSHTFASLVVAESGLTRRGFMSYLDELDSFCTGRTCSTTADGGFATRELHPSQRDAPEAREKGPRNSAYEPLVLVGWKPSHWSCLHGYYHALR